MNPNPTNIPPEKRGNNFFNNNPLLLFAVFAILAIMVYKYAGGDSAIDGALSSAHSTSAYASRTISYSDFKELVKRGEIKQVTIGKQTIQAAGVNGVSQTTYSTRRVIPDETLLPLLDEKGVSYASVNEENWFIDLLFSWVFPILIFVGIWMLVTSRMQKSIGGILKV